MCAARVAWDEFAKFELINKYLKPRDESLAVERKVTNIKQKCKFDYTIFFGAHYPAQSSGSINHF